MRSRPRRRCATIRGTSTPYSLPVALALLKLPTGALTALLGLLLMRGNFVPGLSALDSSAQIIAWAIVFGYAQQLLTRCRPAGAHRARRRRRRPEPGAGPELKYTGPPPSERSMSLSLPALVGHADPMTLELQPDGPLASLAGDPRAAIRTLYRDDAVEAGVWEVTPGVFAGENAGFAEQMYVLSGEATVTSEDGSSVELRPGVWFVAREGWRGTWTCARPCASSI